MNSPYVKEINVFTVSHNGYLLVTVKEENGGRCEDFEFVVYPDPDSDPTDEVMCYEHTSGQVFYTITDCKDYARETFCHE